MSNHISPIKRVLSYSVLYSVYPVLSCRLLYSTLHSTDFPSHKQSAEHQEVVYVLQEPQEVGSDAPRRDGLGFCRCGWTAGGSAWNDSHELHRALVSPQAAPRDFPLAQLFLLIKILSPTEILQ